MLFKKKDEINDEYETIIIGGGLAGLTAANKLAKNGRKVLLLEAHNKLGGFATWFKRAKGNHIFDVSLHGFPVGMIKTCKKYWNKDIASRIVQLKGVRFVNPMYELQSDFTVEDFKSKLTDHFKCPQEQVDTFFNELMNMNYYDAPKMTNGELLNHYFPDRNDVHRFLLEPIVYANGSTLEDPGITYGIVFSNFMSKGVFTFEGGTDLVIQMMKEELLKNGVDIKLQSKVDRIVVEETPEGNKAVGVELKGKLIKAKSVLSNGNIMSTIFKMTGEQYFKPEFIEKAKEVRLNTSSCQVYMGIKEGETLPEIGDLIFYSEAPEFKTDELLDINTSSRTFSVYYPKTRDDGRYTVVASTNARFEDWSNLTEEEYEAEKEKMIEDTLCALEKLVPGVREKIDFIDAATPTTIKKFTHHEKGSSFGTKFEGLDISMKLHKEVDGLFHSGSVGIIMSGWLGAANYGVIQSFEVENYLDQIS
ncbi:MAG: phytoene dehydrogenase [Halobacteriovorax sp.]|nr:phytoene dehydrogenase [Halobacteriovorax sp.]|tara:strand:+ start:34644 stop:36071 length:1428 start_codon:yes stop_codon:yes gene_type:complete